jgi:hypothetical protein
MILLSLALLSLPAFADDTLNCLLRKEKQGIVHTSPLVNGASLAASESSNPLQLAFEASLSPSSVVMFLQDEQKQTRVAFTSSSQAMSSDGAMLRSGENLVVCGTQLDKPEFKIPEWPAPPPFFVCAFDRAEFENGAIKESQRMFSKAYSTPLFGRLPQTFGAESPAVSFFVKYNRMDFANGLEVLVKDNLSGTDAHYVGPAGSLQKSFIIGLTQGNRAEKALFYRLGCAFSADPKIFDQPNALGVF